MKDPQPYRTISITSAASESNSANWLSCHVKVLLIFSAIILNRLWILIYFYFYGHVKLLIECPNLAHGGAVYNYPYIN